MKLLQRKPESRRAILMVKNITYFIVKFTAVLLPTEYLLGRLFIELYSDAIETFCMSDLHPSIRPVAFMPALEHHSVGGCDILIRTIHLFVISGEICGCSVVIY